MTTEQSSAMTTTLKTKWKNDHFTQIQTTGERGRNNKLFPSPFVGFMVYSMGKAENYVEKYLLSQAEKHGFLCYKFVSPGRKGVPDRILIGHGETVFVECKSDTGKTSKIQDLVIDKMRWHGARVCVMATRQDVDGFFKNYPEATHK